MRQPNFLDGYPDVAEQLAALAGIARKLLYEDTRDGADGWTVTS